MAPVVVTVTIFTALVCGSLVTISILGSDSACDTGSGLVLSSVVSGITAIAASGGKGPRRPNNLAGKPSARVDPLPLGSGGALDGAAGGGGGFLNSCLADGAILMGTSLGGAGRRIGACGGARAAIGDGMGAIAAAAVGGIPIGGGGCWLKFPAATFGATMFCKGTEGL